MRHLILFSLMCVISSISFGSSNHNQHGAAGHAPIGVMLDHMHNKGEVMLSYRRMHMIMDGMRDNTSRISTREVAGTMMAPGQKMMALDEMETTVHTVGFMAAPSNNITLVLMGGYVTKSMDMINRMGNTNKQENEGFTDTKLSVLFRPDKLQSNWHMGLTLGIPTGSVNEKNHSTRLGYPLQLGSGTWDLTPSITFTQFASRWSWGAQISSTIRTETNDEGYQLGNRVDGSTWIAHTFAPWVSLSGRLRAEAWGSIRGEDDALNPMMAPATDADLTGGERLWMLAGLNLKIGDGIFQGHRIALEYGQPVYEDLNGPQGSADSVVTAGWQYAF